MQPAARAAPHQPQDLVSANNLVEDQHRLQLQAAPSREGAVSLQQLPRAFVANAPVRKRGALATLPGHPYGNLQPSLELVAYTVEIGVQPFCSNTILFELVLKKLHGSTDSLRR